MDICRIYSPVSRNLFIIVSRLKGLGKWHCGLNIVIPYMGFYILQPIANYYRSDV